MNTTELIQSVRLQLNRANDLGITDTQILLALNNAQLSLSRASNRSAPDMLRKKLTVSTFEGTNGNEIVIPTQANHFIVKTIVVIYGGQHYPIDYATQRELQALKANGLMAVPVRFGVTGNRIELWPRPSEGMTVEVLYQLRLPPLVPVLSRLVDYDVLTNKLYLTSLTDLTTSVTDLECFINVIDQHLGTVKATFQVNALTANENSVTIKTTNLYRDTVFGYEVSDAFTAETVDLDDLVCFAIGTCIPTMYRDFTDYLTLHATITIMRSLKLAVTSEVEYMKVLSEELQDQWNMKPTSTPIKMLYRWR